jgi:hypothetical protein
MSLVRPFLGLVLGVAVTSALSLSSTAVSAQPASSPAPDPATDAVAPLAPDAPPPPVPVAAPVPASEPATTTTAPSPSPAPDPSAIPPLPSSWRLTLSDLTLLRVNPLGLETRARFGLQKRLYAPEGKLGANNFMFFGLYSKLNPAAAYVAAGAELQPAAIFNLRAAFGVQKYFKTLGFLQSFSSPNANYSDETLGDNEDSAQAASLLQGSLYPTLQLRFGPIAVRAAAQLDYWSLDVRDGDTSAYEITLDTLIPDDGWTLATDTDVLYLGIPKLAIGLRHSWVHPFYADSAFPTETDRDLYDGDNAHQRLGLFAAYTFHDRGPTRFNKPTLIFIASWYLQHRYRTGEPDTLPIGGRADDYVSRAFPYLLLGFAFESDFLPVRY